jgi:hypothetical protein
MTAKDKGPQRGPVWFMWVEREYMILPLFIEPASAYTRARVASE